MGLRKRYLPRRSSHFSKSARSGAPGRTVQDWMGHTDLASRLRYLKPNRNQVREKVEAIWK
jgi:integrase